MGLLGKIMDNFKAADFDIHHNMKVKNTSKHLSVDFFNSIKIAKMRTLILMLAIAFLFSGTDIIAKEKKVKVKLNPEFEQFVKDFKVAIKSDDKKYLTTCVYNKIIIADAIGDIYRNTGSTDEVLNDLLKNFKKQILSIKTKNISTNVKNSNSFMGRLNMESDEDEIDLGSFVADGSEYYIMNFGQDSIGFTKIEGKFKYFYYYYDNITP